MKKILFIAALVCVAGLVRAQTITTQSPSSVDSSGATLSALADSAGSTNGTYFFRYGITDSYGSFSATNSITETNEAEVTVAITGLKSRVPYHCQAVMLIGTNVYTGQDVTFTTDTYTYLYDGYGMVNIDATRPQEYEPGSVLAAVIRQFKNQTRDGFLISHNPDGTHKDGSVSSNNLNFKITMDMLDTNLQAMILAYTNSVISGATATNLYQLSNPVTIVRSTADNGVTNFASYTIGMSNCTHILVSGTMSVTNVFRDNSSPREMTIPFYITVAGTTNWSKTLTIPYDSKNRTVVNNFDFSFASSAVSNNAINVVFGDLTCTFTLYGTYSATDESKDQTAILKTLSITGYE